MGLNIFLENLRKIKQLGLRRFIRDSLKFVFHHPKTILFLCYIRYFRYRIVERYHGLANPFKIIRVDPKNITHAKFSINKYLDTGKICDGDWDINTTEYDASRKHQMVVQRFVEGKAWEEIDGFKEELDKIRTTGNAEWAQSKEDLKERYHSIDSLYDSMNKEGYRPELRHENPNRVSTDIDRICVSIGRCGGFIYSGGGHHRLSIAKVLGIKQVPVRVIRRHSHWQETRESVLERIFHTSNSHSDLNELRDELYQNGFTEKHDNEFRYHPDLQDIL